MMFIRFRYILLMVLFSVIGYALNIYKFAQAFTEFSEISFIQALQIVGMFAPPLGVFFGYIFW